MSNPRQRPPAAASNSNVAVSFPTRNLTFHRFADIFQRVFPSSIDLRLRQASSPHEPIPPPRNEVILMDYRPDFCIAGFAGLSSDGVRRFMTFGRCGLVTQVGSAVQIHPMTNRAPQQRPSGFASKIHDGPAFLGPWQPPSEVAPWFEVVVVVFRDGFWGRAICSEWRGDVIPGHTDVGSSRGQLFQYRWVLSYLRGRFQVFWRLVFCLACGGVEGHLLQVQR